MAVRFLSFFLSPVAFKRPISMRFNAIWNTQFFKRPISSKDSKSIVVKRASVDFKIEIVSKQMKLGIIHNSWNIFSCKRAMKELEWFLIFY